jgi:hypothetical protein
MATIEQTHITFHPTLETAVTLVNELNSTEDACGWKYHLASGAHGWFIKIFDEDDVFVGTL